MAIEPPPTPWAFPDPGRLDDADDLVAAGADLAPGTLLAAYRRGMFPMPAGGPGDPMYWWSPVGRGVLPVRGMVVSRSLRRSLRDYEIRVDTAFEEVVDACADPARDSGWINGEIRDAYRALHELGWVHSVEAWRDGHLAGGLYGVAIGGLFAGESMFYRERDASKVALAGLVRLLDDEHGADRLVDTQWQTTHLASLGVVTVTRGEYLERLARALAVPAPAALDRTGRD
ncbi:MAG TPA: leucyl/phenylalanyl-tRNA--protein transferase [Ornithinimicrobium sp.]|nr:leucyl/phenylalanyl-tRNA--protein transferase [Ornithinimicrobium sp.]